jgi:O-antigen/teichoic acid export membrane protein
MMGGSLVLQIANTGLLFFLNLLLARMLSTTAYGAYAYATAWVSVLGVPALLGLDKLLIREVAACRARSAWALLRGLLRWANGMVLASSLGLAILAAFIAWTMAANLEESVLPTFWLAMISLPLLTIMRVRQASLQGLSRVVAGQLSEMLIWPGLFILLLGGAYLLLSQDLTAPWAMSLNVAASSVALLVGVRLLQKATPRAVTDAPPAYDTTRWLRSILPLVLVSSMRVVNARIDIIMLGAMENLEAVGIFAVASRGSAFIPLVLVAVNAALGPTVARLYTIGNMKRLQRIVTRSARLVFLASIPIALCLVLFGDWFLSLFGQEFVQGHSALAILSIGQLFNAFAGPVGLLLLMTGFEREVAVGVGVGALLNSILNTLLIPQYGLEGAALATTVSRIIWNSALVFMVYRRIGIHSTPLGRLSLQRREP